jgi:hypothetical protein
MSPLEEGIRRFLGCIAGDAKTTAGISHNADRCWDRELSERPSQDPQFPPYLEPLNCKYPVSRYQQWSDAGCATCRMLLYAVDEFWPGWTSESLNAGQFIGLDNKDEITVTVTLFTAEEIAGSFQLFRREKCM